MMRAIVDRVPEDFSGPLFDALTVRQISVNLADDVAQAANLSANDQDAIVCQWALNPMDAIRKIREFRELRPDAYLMVFFSPEDVTPSHSRAVALRAGADDAQMWPVYSAEISERMKALQRRRRSSRNDLIIVNGFTWSRSRFRLDYQGLPISLTPAEEIILKMLFAIPGNAVSKARIEGALKKHSGREPTSDFVKVLIWILREKIKDTTDVPLIETMRWQGCYRLAVAGRLAV